MTPPCTNGMIPAHLKGRERSDAIRAAIESLEDILAVEPIITRKFVGTWPEAPAPKPKPVPVPKPKAVKKKAKPKAKKKPVGRPPKTDMVSRLIDEMKARGEWPKKR